MNAFVAVLAFVLWLVIAFLVLRFAFSRYFHEPMRAEAAAAAAALAFAIGTVWPFGAHGGGGASAPQAAVAPAAVTAAPTPGASIPPARDLTAACRTAKYAPAKHENPNGSVDPVVSTENPTTNIADGGRMNRAEHYHVMGWAVNPNGDGLVSAVCLVIDGAIVHGGRVRYGFRRDDVAAAFNRPEVTGSGFEIDVPSDTLTPGSHRLDVVTIVKPGVMQLLRQSRTVTVN